MVDPANVQVEEDDNLLENAAPVEPVVPEPTKIGEGVGSYVQQNVSPAMFNSMMTKARVQNLLDRQEALSGQIVNEGGGEKQSSLVSTAPEWYKPGPPAKPHGAWGDVMGTLAGAAAAPAAQRLQDPNRSPYLKQKDAKQVALAGGMSTLFSNLFNRGAENDKANRAAALQEAQMMKSVPGGKTRAQLELDATDKQLQWARQARADESVDALRRFNQGQTTALHASDDPEAIAQRKQLERLHIPGVSFAETEGMSRDALNHAMRLYHSQLEAMNKAGQSEADTANKERLTQTEANIKRNEALDKDLRDEQQRRGRSAVPGIEWNNNTPPDDTTVRDTRQLYRDAHGFISAIDEMRSLQPRIIALAQKYAKDHNITGGAAKALEMLGPINEWTEVLGPEAKEIANKAKVLQTSISNYIRGENYANMGVPQKWEELKANAMTPLAGSPTAWLRGEATWKALRDDVDQRWRNSVAAYGGHLSGEQDPGAASGAATPEQRMQERPAAPVAPRARYVVGKGVEAIPEAPSSPAGSGAGETTATPTDENGQPVTENDPNYARQAAEDAAKAKALEANKNAPAPTGTKHFTITRGTQSFPADFSPAAEKAFRDKHQAEIANGTIKIE